MQTYSLDQQTRSLTVVRARSRRWTAALTFLIGRSVYAALIFTLCAAPIALSQETGVIHGNAADLSGAPIYGALVLIENATGSRYTTVTDDKGVFRISTLAPGKYSVKISANGFSDWAASEVRASAEPESEPVVAVLQIAPQVTAVTATLPPDEVAAEQLRTEMKQRTLAVIPNFYVSYEDHPVPLSAKQKFHLAFRLLIDPTTVATAGAVAGIQQAKNSYWEWGQGAGAYGKRFAAAYGTAAQSLLITSGVAASLLRQDPRYFYNGRGTVARRAGYALGSAFRTKGNNGKWQPPYAGVIGTVISAEISSTYYPGARTQYSLLGRTLLFHFAGLAAVNLAQEFILHRVTSHKAAAQSAATSVLREGTAVRLIAAHGLSSKETHDGGTVNFIVAEDLIVHGKVIARAGDIASGQVSKISRAQDSGDAIDVVLNGVTLKAGATDVPLRSSQARGSADRLQYKVLAESGKIELTLFVGKDVQFPDDH